MTDRQDLLDRLCAIRDDLADVEAGTTMVRILGHPKALDVAFQALDQIINAIQLAAIRGEATDESA
jgi:hypothetical protein